ncbi:bifunctional AP-4-A phosphorylase/ADP sulfurylase, partial [Dimargaris verticillata]
MAPPRTNDLAALVRQTYDTAKESGALLFTPTSLHVQEAKGIAFEVRLVQALLQKPKAPKAPTAKDTEAPRTNPFLPPDPALFVMEYGNENLVLNKYCVSPYHLLIVTKEYEPQGALLLPSEFQTACWVFEQMPQKYLLFYNAGPLS